jgi:putative heme-binding domain-containing protein
LFFEKAETECQRCHQATVDNQLLGGNAGPNLTGTGDRLSREEIMISIIRPNDTFAPGYEQLVVTLTDGTVVAGRVISESTDTLVLEVPIVGDEDRLEAIQAGEVVERRSIATSQIENRDRGLSGMPEGFGEILSPFELRDLVEFLAGQKSEGTAAAEPNLTYNLQLSTLNSNSSHLPSLGWWRRDLRAPPDRRADAGRSYTQSRPPSPGLCMSTPTA